MALWHLAPGRLGQCVRPNDLAALGAALWGGRRRVLCMRYTVLPAHVIYCAPKPRRCVCVCARARMCACVGRAQNPSRSLRLLSTISASMPASLQGCERGFARSPPPGTLLKAVPARILVHFLRALLRRYTKSLCVALSQRL